MNVTDEGEWMKMNMKKWLIGISALGVVGGGAYYFAPAIQENNLVQSETIKEEKFEELKEAKIEIMDTSAFADKNIEKWFEKNKGDKGESLYYDNDYTYVLVSGGDKSNDNDIIWLDGVRKMNDNLIVGYEFKDGKEFGVKKKTDEAPTLLIRTKGEFKDVKGIEVEKEEPKPVTPKVTTKEEKVEEETTKDKKETSSDKEVDDKKKADTKEESAKSKKEEAN